MACIHCNAFKGGETIIRKHQRQFESDKQNSLFIKSTVIEFYGSFNHIQEALHVFYSSSHVNVVNVNCIMKALIGNDSSAMALTLYDKYLYQGNVAYDYITHILALKACVNCNDYEKGKEIHSKHLESCVTATTTKQDLNIMMSSLIHFYGEFDEISNALNIFWSYYIDKRNNKHLLSITTLNAMLKLYHKHNMCNECVALFELIEKKAFVKRSMTDLKGVVEFYSIGIKACTNGMLVEFGKHIHQRLRLEGKEKILNHILIQINLINMYAKLGVVAESERIFLEFLGSKCIKWNVKNNIKIWNTMIFSYGVNGNIEKATQIFRHVLSNGKRIEADVKTYILIMNVCYHGGAWEEAIYIWSNEIHTRSIKYNAHVISNLIHCLSSNAQFRKAKEILNEYDNRAKLDC